MMYLLTAVELTPGGSSTVHIYRGADKSLARPGRIQANVSVRMASISFGALPCKKTLDDSSRIDVVEIARVPDMLPSLFPSWSGLRTYQHPGIKYYDCVSAVLEGRVC